MSQADENYQALAREAEALEEEVSQIMKERSSPAGDEDGMSGLMDEFRQLRRLVYGDELLSAPGLREQINGALAGVREADRQRAQLRQMLEQMQSSLSLIATRLDAVETAIVQMGGQLERQSEKGYRDLIGPAAVWVGVGLLFLLLRLIGVL